MNFIKWNLKYFLAINDFKSAYENRLKINEFEKKYFDKDREKNIQNLVESFESEEKEKEIEKMNFEKELSLKNNRFQKPYYFVSFGFC
ncbi:MAG: hypothetical protein IPH28_19765 [Cytophagaceae bacterium]|nr:hypothetical protein [Cytophagaceae bacterium]